MVPVVRATCTEQMAMGEGVPGSKRHSPRPPGGVGQQEAPNSETAIDTFGSACPDHRTRLLGRSP